MNTSLDRELVEGLSAALDEPVWLRDHRLAALDVFNSIEWPSTEEEEWRRTPIEQIPLKDWILHKNSDSPVIPASIKPLADSATGSHAPNNNSSPSIGLSNIQAEQGVLLLPLSLAARENESLVRETINRLVPTDYDRFTALGAAIWSEGLFCYIPKGVTVEQPLLHLIGKRAGTSAIGHTLVLAEEGSTATIIEACASDSIPESEPSLAHQTIEIVLKSAAQVKLARIQNWDDSTNALVTARANLDRDANLVLASADFGGQLSKERLEVNLSGTGSHADIMSLFVGRDAQHIEHNTRQNHLGVGSSSELLIKGALNDNSTAVQYGVIKILPEGQKTAGYQTMRNLLLSEGASADPIPVLEIEADDVQCSHAAAVGPVDQDHIFYLQSRGIPPELAERMVVEGFLEVVAQRLPCENLRKLVANLVETKLDDTRPNKGKGTNFE